MSAFMLNIFVQVWPICKDRTAVCVQYTSLCWTHMYIHQHSMLVLHLFMLSIQLYHWYAPCDLMRAVHHCMLGITVTHNYAVHIVCNSHITACSVIVCHARLHRKLHVCMRIYDLDIANIELN